MREHRTLVEAVVARDRPPCRARTQGKKPHGHHAERSSEDPELHRSLLLFLPPRLNEAAHVPAASSNARPGARGSAPKHLHAGVRGGVGTRQARSIEASRSGFGRRYLWTADDVGWRPAIERHRRSERPLGDEQIEGRSETGGVGKS